MRLPSNKTPTRQLCKSSGDLIEEPCLHHEPSIPNKPKWFCWSQNLLFAVVAHSWFDQNTVSFLFSVCPNKRSEHLKQHRGNAKAFCMSTGCSKPASKTERSWALWSRQIQQCCCLSHSWPSPDWAWRPGSSGVKPPRCQVHPLFWQLLVARQNAHSPSGPSSLVSPSWPWLHAGS